MTDDPMIAHAAGAVKRQDPNEISPERFNLLASLQNAARRRVDRAWARLQAAEEEHRDAERARSRAQDDFQEYVKRAALAAPQQDLFAADVGGIQFLAAGDFGSRPGFEDLATTDGTSVAWRTGQIDLSRPDATITAHLEQGDGPAPPLFHLDACGKGDFLGFCKYGAADCPAGWPAEVDQGCELCLAQVAHLHHVNGANGEAPDPAAEAQAVQDPDAPITWVLEDDGTITLEVKEKRLKFAGLKDRVLPAGTITDLDPAPVYQVFRNMAADEWQARPGEEPPVGQMLLSIGTITIPESVLDEAASGGDAFPAGPEDAGAASFQEDHSLGGRSWDRGPDRGSIPKTHGAEGRNWAGD